MLIMIKKMLFRGAIMVAGIITTNAVIEKLEMSNLKRKAITKNKNSKKEVEELTDEQIIEALELNEYQEYTVN